MDALRSLLRFAGGVFALIPLSFLYATAVRYSMIGYVNALCTFSLALGVGFIASLIPQAGKDRKKGVTILIGLVLGVVVLWFSWAFWYLLRQPEGGIFSVSRFLLALHPSVFLQEARFFVQLDSHLTAGKERAAVFLGCGLYMLWTLEALVLLFGSALIGLGLVAEPEQNNENLKSSENQP